MSTRTQVASAMECESLTEQIQWVNPLISKSFTSPSALGDPRKHWTYLQIPSAAIVQAAFVGCRHVARNSLSPCSSRTF